MAEFDTSRRIALRDTLERLLALDVPSQFLHLSADDLMRTLCSNLALGEPYDLAGNAVVGDLASARYVLAAHMDEASFNVIKVNGAGASLAACHRYVDSEQEVLVRLMGIRDGVVKSLGISPIAKVDGAFHCLLTIDDVRLGDRAVYYQPTVVSGDLIAGKAIDDRCGALIALHAASDLKAKGISVAVILSDGEQSLPDGYFSRNFPHVLGSLRADATVVFVDGIFQDGLEPQGFTGPPTGALVVPHSAFGKGYTVQPALFAWLRDVAIPQASRDNIDVQVSSAYHSRGDDWGMVTNPTSGRQHSAFFVSFGGWGSTPSRRVVNLSSIEHCLLFLTRVVSMLTPDS